MMYNLWYTCIQPCHRIYRLYLLFIKARHNAVYKRSFLLEPVVCYLLPDLGVLFWCY